MATDLEMAYAALTAKKERYDLLFGYYDGAQPLIYSSERLYDVFKNINAKFRQNWCAVVVDAVLERLNLMQFVVAENDEATEMLNRRWAITEMSLDSDDAHLAALVTGEAYIIAWREDGEETEAFYNDPRTCHIFYEADNPRKPRFGCKWWQGEDMHRYLTLYYPDRLEYYRSRNDEKNAPVQSAAAFEPAEVPSAPNPWGFPIFHIRRERRVVKSELTNILEMQDAINKLLADMMVAGEYAAFPQRYIISQLDVRNKMKNAPDEIWAFPAGDNESQPTSVGQFSVVTLDNYLSAIEQIVNSVAVISRTPKHYFLSQGGDPSGEALIAMEAPLNKKATKYIERFSSTWRKVAKFMLRLEGIEVDELDITPTFDKPETVQPMTAATIRKTNIESGIPLTTQLRDEGWTQQELDDMQEDKEQEAATQQSGLGAALINAQTQFDRGGQNGQMMNGNANSNGAMMNA
jgi:hypothetical protein